MSFISRVLKCIWHFQSFKFLCVKLDSSICNEPIPWEGLGPETHCAVPPPPRSVLYGFFGFLIGLYMCSMCLSTARDGASGRWNGITAIECSGALFELLQPPHTYLIAYKIQPHHFIFLPPTESYTFYLFFPSNKSDFFFSFCRQTLRPSTVRACVVTLFVCYAEQPQALLINDPGVFLLAQI